MGGCSSKPQTAECSNEVLLGHPSPLNLLFHPSHSSPPRGSQHTLKSLFDQHGRDGEDLLGNAQTLHELLLHAVDSIELPESENQSAENTEANPQISFPCKQNSPVSVLSNAAAANNPSTCTKIEGSLPNVAQASEETGAQLESLVSSNPVQATEENPKKCTESEGFTSNSAEGNQEKGAANLEGFLHEEKSRKLEVILPALPEENAQDCIKADGFLSNVAEENQANAGKLEGFMPNLAEVGVLSNFAEENASKLESESSPGLEPKSDLLEIEGSTASECAQTRGPDQGPKSIFLKISEPNLLESPTTDVLLKIKASDAMEIKEAEMQGFTAIAMKDEIKRDVQYEIPVKAEKTPKQDATCKKNEKKALQDEETEEHIAKAMEGVETEKAIEGKKTEMQPAKALEIEKDEISQGREKAEVRNEKAMEGELLKVQFESRGISLVQGEKAMQDDMQQATTEKAMECEKLHMQDEKELEGRKTGVQDEKSKGEDEKTGVQNKRVDGKDACVEKQGSMQDTQKKAAQHQKQTGVQDEKRRVQRKEAGEQDEETWVYHEEKAEDENAMANVSPLPVNAQDEKVMANVSAIHVNAEDEEAMADVPSSHVNEYFADIFEKHTIMDSCFEPSTGSEQSMVIGIGPILKLASKENTIEAEELNKSDEKKLAFKDNNIDAVADLGLTEKLEADLKELASDENSIEAVGPVDVEVEEFEHKKTRKTEHIEKIKSHESSIEAVARCTHTKLCNTFNALDDEQSKPTDTEQMLHIERHGKLEHGHLSAEADKLDEENNAMAPVLEQSLIEAAIGNTENSDQVVRREKRDDQTASEHCANEEKRAPESLHEGKASEESSNIECSSRHVVENDTNDVNVKVEVSSSDACVLLQKDNDAEKLQCGHMQMPSNELHLITSKHIESALCLTPESSVHENLPCPTVVETDVEKRVVDINSSSLSAAEKSSIECGKPA